MSNFNKFNEKVRNILNEANSNWGNNSIQQQQQQTQNQQQQQQTQNQQQQQQTQNQQQNLQNQEVDKKVFDKVYQEALNDTKNRIAFLNGKSIQYYVVDQQGENTKTTRNTDPKNYTINNIKKIETTEARNLISALEKISLYIKKGKPAVTAGERAKGLQQIGQGLAGLAGVGDMYGGVR